MVTAQEKVPVVVLSPGHGWMKDGVIDPGATNNGLVEKDINLEVAQYAKKYLERCPIEVHLTRTGDDPKHTLNDVDEIVNNLEPTIGISIHTNSDDGNPTGTEGWYTVNGYDDTNSKVIAEVLAEHISSRLEIEDRGAKPETENRHGGLYIHWWDAPSALVEIAFLQGDADLLRNRLDDFGRSIAAGTLEYLDINPECANWAKPQEWYISTYFPGDVRKNLMGIVNDSLYQWTALEYKLVSVGNRFGADNEYPLLYHVYVHENAEWELKVEAPSKPGIYRQEWQLGKGEQLFKEKITVYIIVVPEEAREIKEDIDRQIAEWMEKGEEEIDKLIQELERKAIEWITKDLPNIICNGASALIIGVVLSNTFLLIKKRNTYI